MCIFIRCAIANIVMERIRQTGTRQTRMLWDWAKELLEQRPEYQYFPSVYQREKDPEYSFDVQEIGKLDRIVDITDQTVPDYDYGKLLEEHADSILRGIHTQYAKKNQASAPQRHWSTV